MGSVDGPTFDARVETVLADKVAPSPEQRSLDEETALAARAFLHQIAERRFRQIADYSGEPIELDKAAWSVERADTFVEANRAFCDLAA